MRMAPPMRPSWPGCASSKRRLSLAALCTRRQEQDARQRYKVSGMRDGGTSTATGCGRPAPVVINPHCVTMHLFASDVCPEGRETALGFCPPLPPFALGAAGLELLLAGPRLPLLPLISIARLKGRAAAPMWALWCKSASAAARRRPLQVRRRHRRLLQVPPPLCSLLRTMLPMPRTTTTAR